MRDEAERSGGMWEEMWKRPGWYVFSALLLRSIGVNTALDMYVRVLAAVLSLSQCFSTFFEQTCPESHHKPPHAPLTSS